MDKNRILRDSAEQIVMVIGTAYSKFGEAWSDMIKFLANAWDKGIETWDFMKEFQDKYGDNLSKKDKHDQEDILDYVEEIYTTGYWDYVGFAAKPLNEETRRDYNAKYGGANGPFEEIYKTANGPGTKSETKKPAVKSKPGNWKYDDGGWGPIPRTGYQRSDYEAKLSKTGALVESFVSPALKESINNYKSYKYLKENKLINPEDLDLLEE
jgi:hypothetical protein